MQLDKVLVRISLAGLAAMIMLAGCDKPPAPPATASGSNVKMLNVTDPAEQAAATELEETRTNYLYRLNVIAGYYDQVGNMDKLTWARREIKNLQDSRTFGWSGLPEILPPEGESVADADERALAEYVVAARKAYLDALDRLHQYYVSTGAEFKASLVANQKARFDPVRTYMYFLSAEVPPANLQPTDVIPEADALYAEAVRLFHAGKGPLHTFVTTSYPKEREALLKFRQLIDNYPTSNKLALAAYYTGDIYKEYFNEDIRAILWYERAFTWDPNITEPARFQAAVVYDLRLHNKEKAVDLYKQVILHEQFNGSNVDFAKQRIDKLSGR